MAIREQLEEMAVPIANRLASELYLSDSSTERWTAMLRAMLDMGEAAIERWRNESAVGRESASRALRQVND